MMLPVPRRPSAPVPSLFFPERPGCVAVIDHDRVWADGLCGALEALREIVRQVPR
jgi:hypothetical protein